MSVSQTFSNDTLLKLPPTLFQELENVELMLMTKEDRVGRNFSYTLGTLTRPSCIPSLRRSSGVSRVDPRFPMKFKMMYEGDEVMKLDRIPTQGTWYTRCICLCPYTDNFRVCSPAENVIGYVERLPYWFEWIRGLRARFHWRYSIMDENKEKIFDIIRNTDNFSEPFPLNVQRVSDKELVAQISRRWMMEPLGEIRSTHSERWGFRILVPMPLKERVLILAMTLYVDYSELSRDPWCRLAMAGRTRPNTPPA
ncbi:uncharacterized protein isoform X2 [Choristoneura fumiferana]|uniref:uncharacterized protein isoform X2 n=1 Tax=Choristoneura fumiferana TaxID=7141 RepID=UPI003D153E49